MPPATMHAKSDSEVTSVDQSSPPRSPRRPIYYVQSPSNHDVEKMSYGSSPLGSPHHYYHCSPIHHSRESSTTRFSASLKNSRSISAWKKLRRGGEDTSDDDEDEDENDAARMSGPGRNARLFFCFVLLFAVLFTAFSLILWGASKSYEPKVLVENIVFRSFEMQAGNDRTGVATDMLSLNSTVRIFFRNPGTFFGVHVSSTPMVLHCYQLKIASGQMEKFFQKRKTHRKVVTTVLAHQVPLYGGLAVVDGGYGNHKNMVVPLNLTFTIRSKAYILGSLVRSKFYSRIRCSVTLRSTRLDKPSNLTNSCTYN